MEIRKEQLAVLHEVAKQETLEYFTSAVIENLSQVDAGIVVNQSSDQLRATVREALQAALQFDIREFPDLCQWTYLRLTTQYQFWNNLAFRYFLDEPLFHPKAKVRNLVTSYKLAVIEATNKEK